MQLISSKRAVVDIMRLRKKRKESKVREEKRREGSYHSKPSDLSRDGLLA
jgi:hypothetical protein